MPSDPQPTSDVTTRRYRRMIEEFNESSAVDRNCRMQLMSLGKHLVFKIEGRATLTGYSALATKAMDVINTRRSVSLIVDLSLCESIASSPLGVLGFVMMTFQRAGGRVYLVSSNETVRKALRILGLDKVYEARESVDEIIAQA